MDIISRSIDDYEKFRSKFSRGLLNAATEQELTGSIKLTDSQIQFPFISPEFLLYLQGKMARLEQYKLVDTHQQYDIAALIQQHPEVEDIMRVLEVAYHEVFHVIQKHAYRSVYSFVDSLQKIEGWEHTLFFNHAGSGGKWTLGESFVSCLRELDESTAEGVASRLSQSCRLDMKAAEVQEGLSLLHLIEGQALVASRVAAKTFELLPLPDSDVYSKAWKLYQASGGTEPMVFVLLSGAALRHGTIEEEGLYPNPVDIFNYLLKFVASIEGLYHILDCSYGEEASAAASFQQGWTVLIDTVKNRSFDPFSTSDIDCTYIRNQENPLKNENKQHYLQSVYQHLGAIDYEQESFGFGASIEDVISQSLLKVSRVISSIIEHSYTRVAKPMKGEFLESGDNIAEAVGYYTAQMLPDYYREKTIIRYFMDQPFVLGELFPNFLMYINDKVKVKPFPSMPEISHIEYLSMALTPDLIKKLLYVYAWRQGELPESEIPVAPYCCSQHGVPSIDNASPEFYEACGDSESVGRAIKIMFNRPVSDFFEE